MSRACLAHHAGFVILRLRRSFVFDLVREPHHLSLRQTRQDLRLPERRLPLALSLLVIRSMSAERLPDVLRQGCPSC